MTPRLPMNVLRAFLSMHWAMTPEAMRLCHRILTRQGAGPEAVAAELGHPLENSWTASVRDGIAYIPVVGPMIRYANSFKAISGATSYETIARDLRAALVDGSVRGIVLNLDTPGGELSGCLDVAEQIRQADERKPVYALASGTCASAGYALAAATRRIVGNPSSITGSLGVCLAIEDDTEAKREAGIRDIEIVSSQSPYKNLDPSTDEGRAALQLVVNDLATVYGGAIARYRGLSDGEVFERYGAGRVIVGEKALAAGLIDEIAYSEDFHAALVDELRTTGPRVRAVRSNAAADGSPAQPQQEPTMKYKKGAQVRVAAGGASVVADGTEGTVDEVLASAGLYRLALADCKQVLLAEDQVADPETDEEKKAREKAAKANAETDEEELDEDGKPKAKPKAEGDEEELDEDGKPKGKQAASASQRAAKAERERVLGIQALAQPGEEALVQACIDDPSCSVADAALKLRQAQAGKPAARLAALKRADGAMPKAGVPPVNPAAKQSPGAARVIAAIGRVFPSAKKPTSAQA